MTSSGSGPLRLTKHHGAGNDFLVVVDRDGTGALDPVLVAALCDRHRGVGADGVIRVAPSTGPDGADVTMELRNADGGPAETSGNGLRCLAQAAVDAGLVDGPTFRVGTEAGIRRVDYQPGVPGTGTASAWVEMGVARLGPEQDLGSDAPTGSARVTVARRADVGNPHLVLIAGQWDEDVVDRLGPRLGSDGAGRNVEFVTVEAHGVEGPGLRLRVWERGVGETLACGTGSVAAAAVARAAGLSGDEVVVRNPGGALQVRFQGDEAWLGGPVHKVAEVEVDPVALTAGAAVGVR
jgi:diaminopimelate epimerase